MVGQEQVNRNEPQFREAVIERAAINETERTAELSFSSETPVKRWWGPKEILAHDEGSVDLTRLTEIGVLLFGHNSGDPIGRVEKVWLDQADRKGKALVRFDEDEQSDRIFRKVLSGTLKGVSVGYRVQVWEDVEPGEKSTCGRFDGPCAIARKWEPLEISIVSVPADANVGVGRSEEVAAAVGRSANTTTDQRGEDKMDEKNPVITPTVSDEESRAAAVESERQRCAEITTLCREFGVDPEPHLTSGSSVDEVRKVVLDKLAEERKAVPSVRIVADESEKFRVAAIDGLSLRAGIKLDKPADGANEFRGLRLLDLARECVERVEGKKVRFSSEDELIRRAITGASDFPVLLANVANKSMATAYQAVPTTFQIWTKVGNASDFKPQSRVRLSEADDLVEMTEHGEFKHSEITDAGENVKVLTYGRSFSLTRKALINDDLGALATLPAKYGAAARRKINELVYGLINSNVTLSDKTALFHANHKNLAATGAALSVATLGEGRAAMRKQKGLKGKESLNIAAAFLLVPTDLETAAEQLIASVVDPSKNNNTPNPFANKLQVVADPVLDDGSAAAWYLAAAPGYVDTVEVTYLNGKQSPTLESQVAFDMLGMKYRIYMDVGAAVLDFRGLYKNAGPSAG